jgi:hypothetical protein
VNASSRWVNDFASKIVDFASWGKASINRS